MRKERTFSWLLYVAFLIPALLFLNIWQTYRYHSLEKELENLVVEQKVWLEKNKKNLTGIAVYDSPGRIAQIAENDLGLKQAEPEDVWLIRTGNGTEGDR